MALKYTEEKLNSLDKETLIQLFLSQQEQLENIDHNGTYSSSRISPMRGAGLTKR